MVTFQSHEARCICKPALPNPTHRKMEGQPCQRMAGHEQLGGVDKNNQTLDREIDIQQISQKNKWNICSTL